MPVLLLECRESTGIFFIQPKQMVKLCLCAINRYPTMESAVSELGADKRLRRYRGKS